MAKKIFVAVTLLNFSMILHAQSPLGNRGREWNEQDGYAIVNNQRNHYWLYSIEYFCKYHNWDKRIIGNNTNDRLYILRSLLFRWVEKQGWTIDYDNAWFSDPLDNNLPFSVKMLMYSRGTGDNFLDSNTIFMDVSVTIVTHNTKKATLQINYWNFMQNDSYTTWGFPLIKF